MGGLPHLSVVHLALLLLLLVHLPRLTNHLGAALLLAEEQRRHRVQLWGGRPGEVRSDGSELRSYHV